MKMNYFGMFLPFPYLEVVSGMEWNRMGKDEHSFSLFPQNLKFALSQNQKESKEIKSGLIKFKLKVPKYPYICKHLF